MQVVSLQTCLGIIWSSVVDVLPSKQISPFETPPSFPQFAAKTGNPPTPGAPDKCTALDNQLGELQNHYMGFISTEALDISL